MQPAADGGGVFHVVVHILAHFTAALRGVDGLGSALHDVGTAVVLGGLSAVPEGFQGYRPPLGGTRPHGFGNDHVAAAQARESGGLGEAAELHGHLSGALKLVDAVRDTLLADIGFIGGIKENQALIGAGVVHPALEIGPRKRRARGVVGQTKVDDVGPFGRKGGNEAVFRRAGQIDDARPAPGLFVERPGSARHDIGIHINGVDGISHGNDAFPTEKLLKIPQIALCAVTDEDVRRIDLHATGGEIALRNGLTQKGVALFRAVAPEALGCGLLIHGLVQSRDDGRRQGAGHVSDAEADDLGFRVRPLESLHLVRDVGKKIAARQLQILLIDPCHWLFLLLRLRKGPLPDSRR